MHTHCVCVCVCVCVCARAHAHWVVILCSTSNFYTADVTVKNGRDRSTELSKQSIAKRILLIYKGWNYIKAAAPPPPAPPPGGGARGVGLFPFGPAPSCTQFPTLLVILSLVSLFCWAVLLGFLSFFFFSPLTTFAMVGSSKVVLTGEGSMSRLGTGGKNVSFQLCLWLAPPEKATRRLWGADVPRVISK